MIENKFLQIGLDFATSIAALGDDPAECFKSFEHVSSDFENDFPSVFNRIPPALTKSLEKANCWISWWVDDELKDIPPVYENCESGDITWRLDYIGEVDSERHNFVSSSKFKQIKNDTKPIWESSLAIARLFSIHNANVYPGFLAIDIKNEKQLPVYILDSYRYSKCNGFLLAPSLVEFLDHWSRLGFVTLREDSLANFTNNFTQPINADCDFSSKWRHWLLKP